MLGFTDIILISLLSGFVSSWITIYFFLNSKYNKQVNYDIKNLMEWLEKYTEEQEDEEELEQDEDEEELEQEEDEEELEQKEDEEELEQKEDEKQEQKEDEKQEQKEEELEQKEDEKQEQKENNVIRRTPTPALVSRSVLLNSVNNIPK